MPRCQLLALLLTATASAAILPPALQEYSRQGIAQVWKTPDHAGVWEEYGLTEAETAEYKGSGKPFTIVAWRMKDSTGALAAWQWQRPADSVPLKGMRLAASFPHGVIAASGNYLLRFDGYRPTASELQGFFADMPDRRGDPLPMLPTYLSSGIASNSERYVIGEKSLTEFVPGWTAQRAGIDLGAEAQVAQINRYTLAIFRYPTPHIARMKMEEFSKDSNLATHRSGPLVAVLFDSDGPPPDPKASESILKPIEYRAVITENEANPNNPIKDAAKMMLSIFALAGILLAICLGAGVVFGGIRIFARSGKGRIGDSIQVLHLGDR